MHLGAGAHATVRPEVTMAVRWGGVGPRSRRALVTAGRPCSGQFAPSTRSPSPDDLSGVTQLSLSDVSVEFGATTILSGITFTVAEGERWGIVGRNGSGKTSLFRVITGAIKPATG